MKKSRAKKLRLYAWLWGGNLPPRILRLIHASQERHSQR